MKGLEIITIEKDKNESLKNWIFNILKKNDCLDSLEKYRPQVTPINIGMIHLPCINFGYPDIAFYEPINDLFD